MIFCLVLKLEISYIVINILKDFDFIFLENFLKIILMHGEIFEFHISSFALRYFIHAKWQGYTHSCDTTLVVIVVRFLDTYLCFGLLVCHCDLIFEYLSLPNSCYSRYLWVSAKVVCWFRVYSKYLWVSAKVVLLVVVVGFLNTFMGFALFMLMHHV